MSSTSPLNSSSSSPISIPLHRLTERRRSAALSPRSPRLSDPLSSPTSEQSGRISRTFQTATSSSTSSLPETSRSSPRRASERRLSKSSSGPLTPREKCVVEVQVILENCPFREACSVELSRKPYHYCFAEENRIKDPEQITSVFQNSNFLIKRIIQRLNWLKETLEKKPEKTKEQELLIVKLSSLVYFSSTERGGLKNFLHTWDAPAEPFIKRILNICINQDQEKGINVFAVLRSWGHPQAIDNTTGILQIITNKENEIKEMCTQSYAWVNDPTDEKPLLNIDWFQIVRSLVQGSPLVNSLTIGRKAMEKKNLEGDTVTSKQKYFMRDFFVALADEYDKVAGQKDDGIVSISPSQVLPEQEKLDEFCNSTELTPIADRIASLGDLAYTVPMMLSISCWAKPDWIIRTKLFPDLFPKDYSNINGHIGYNVASEENVFLDASVEIESPAEYYVRQRRTFKIVYCKGISGTEGRAPIASPRHLPAIAHVVFQFTICPSQERKWAGLIQVRELTVHKYDHLDPLIQIFKAASID